MDKCFTNINAKQILIKTLGVGIFKSHEIDSTTKKILAQEKRNISLNYYSTKKA